MQRQHRAFWILSEKVKLHLNERILKTPVKSPVSRYYPALERGHAESTKSTCRSIKILYRVWCYKRARTNEQCNWLSKIRLERSYHKLLTLQKCTQAEKMFGIWQEMLKMLEGKPIWEGMHESGRQTPRDDKRYKSLHVIHHNLEVATQEFDVVISEVLSFNIHSIRSVLFVKLKTTISQRAEIYKCKLNTGSNGNLMPLQIV